jgi:hypothetical protein
LEGGFISRGALGISAGELISKAEAIENAVFDLKAVNPHAKSNEDTGRLRS